MKTEILRSDHPVALQHAQDVLQHGGLVAFPTDTIYGLAAFLQSEQSIEQLYIARGSSSSSSRAVSVLVSSLDEVLQVCVKIPPSARLLAEAFWPGALTLVLPGKRQLPANLLQDGMIGVRVPNHPVALALLRKTGPLAVTSASQAGEDHSRYVQDVLKQLSGRVHLVLDGPPTPKGVPSTIVDCKGDGPLVVRRGPVSEAQIRHALQED